VPKHFGTFDSIQENISRKIHHCTNVLGLTTRPLLRKFHPLQQLKTSLA
jgi:hypothetical protein